MNRLTLGCLGACSLSIVAAASPAHAQETVVVAAPPPAVESRGWAPNGSLLRSGLFTLGLSYAPALVVAIESDNEADDNLFIPVAGPWLDLAERDCRGDCDRETLNKVLLVTDGVFQGLGALQILASFVVPEDRGAVTVVGGEAGSEVTVRMAPGRIAGGPGIIAVGEF